MDKKTYQRRDKLIKEKKSDPYKEKKKWGKSTQCPECHASFVKGRWSWKKITGETQKVLCPACRRITENMPAGLVKIRGSFFEEHQDEILNLIHNTADGESKEHPLERIMSITDESDHTLVRTTGPHVAHRIGTALFNAYKGGLSFPHEKSEGIVRIEWER